MAVSDIEAVLNFLKNNGFSEAESALKEDIVEKADLGSFDPDKFFYPMVPPPPPVRVRSFSRWPEDPGGRECWNSSTVSEEEEEEFVSLLSSTSDVCSSEFINPYGICSSSQTLNDSESSSERLSQFGTARDYPDFEMQNEPYWFNEKDEENFMTPNFVAPDFFGLHSEDKFIAISETENRHENYSYPSLKEAHLNDFNFEVVGDISSFGSAPDRTMNPIFDYYANNDVAKGYKGPNDLNDIVNEKALPIGLESFDTRIRGELSKKCQEPEDAADGEDKADDELLKYSNEDEYEVFNLRIIHRKNRTGFEESKDLLIVLNTVLAGRYYVTGHLGSAAFSKVVQAQDLQTGTDVCLKIIRNDKEFFDQSLDEIKLLKLVNKHDPADECHILRLYDYFYHKEHLFIVTELLQANLYEFQKFNQESQGEPYFTLNRLQVITRQCLEALQYLHNLGIIHCDLKPENILIKSYRRCEIKIIDLGSSCFQKDSLRLYVQSRSYRAPEVMLGLGYDEKIDTWSLGCVLAELCSGEVLFPNDAVAMILARMIGMLGPIDLEMLLKGQETHKYFTKEYDICYVNEETNELEYIIPEMTTLEQQLQVTDTMFIDFIRSLLSINPKRRPTARQALKHPWLSYVYKSK